MENSQKAFVAPLFMIIAAVLLIGGGAYVYLQKPANQANQPVTATLSDEQTLQIAQKVFGSALMKTNPACFVFNNKKADGYVIYDITRKFGNSCPGDPTSEPTFPSFKINLTTGDVLIQSLDGEYRSRSVETSQITSKANIKNYVGYQVAGYYTSYSQEGWEGEKKQQCDAFVVTGGDQEFIKYFSYAVTDGNTVNRFNSSSNLIFNLNLGDVSKNDSILIKDSSITSTVTLTISIPQAKGTEAPVCFSFGKIISVEK